MRIRTVIWISVIVLFSAVLLASIGFSALAQGEVTPKTATPLPSPANNGGKAQWTVKNETFKSDYPNGFEFALEATSTGGKITGASVIWRHGPEASRTRVQGKIDANGKITARSEELPTLPQWVDVEYWWMLNDEAGNVYETPHKHAEYADNTRKWHRAESDDVIVFWQDGLPDEVGQVTIDALQEARPMYLKNWGKLLNYKPRVILYLNHDAFEEWSPGVGTAAGGVVRAGQTSQVWGGTVQVYFPSQGVEGLAYSTVLHEVAHLYQYFNGGQVGDRWIIEGNATFFEKYQDYDYLARVKQMARAGRLPTLQDGGPTVSNRDGYDIGYAFFVWLTQTYGDDAHLKFWTLIAKGTSTRDALQQVTGLEFVEMETTFRKWLGAANPEAPTPLPTMSFDFPPTPTYEPTPGG
ncbi:MAG: hypothetical protein IT324_20350 [Anaerolineae bacterium]|nr:hypothetical protein [Anaerolineae bacterium]